MRTPASKCGKGYLVADGDVVTVLWSKVTDKEMGLVLPLPQVKLCVGWTGHLPVPWRCRANSQTLLLQLVWKRLLLPIHLSNPTCASGSSLGPISSLKPYGQPEFMPSLIFLSWTLNVYISHFCTYVANIFELIPEYKNCHCNNITSSLKSIILLILFSRGENFEQNERKRTSIYLALLCAKYICGKPSISSCNFFLHGIISFL